MEVSLSSWLPMTQLDRQIEQLNTSTGSPSEYMLVRRRALSRQRSQHMESREAFIFGARIFNDGLVVDSSSRLDTSSHYSRLSVASLILKRQDLRKCALYPYFEKLASSRTPCAVIFFRSAAIQSSSE